MPFFNQINAHLKQPGQWWARALRMKTRPCFTRLMPAPAPAPLILTLALDADSQAHFDALRKQHFPPAINYLAAHLTLFHHLPGQRVGRTAQRRPAARGALGQRFGELSRTDPRWTLDSSFRH